MVFSTSNYSINIISIWELFFFFKILRKITVIVKINIFKQLRNYRIIIINSLSLKQEQSKINEKSWLDIHKMWEKLNVPVVERKIYIV